MARSSRFQAAPGRARILETEIDLVDYADTMRAMEQAIESGDKITVGFVNVHSVMKARENPNVHDALRQLTYAVPDGMPLVWLSRLTDTPLRERVYGPDLFGMFCDRSQQKGYKQYLYGSTQEVLDRLQQNLLQRYPNLQIAGSFSPPFGPVSREQEEEIIARIQAARPDVLWVGLGCPKQEQWMVRMRPALDVPVMAAIGAAFDFYAGTLRQAPRVWQNSGLEWLYRLIQEPRRLARRYLHYNPRFVAAVFRQAMQTDRQNSRQAVVHENGDIGDKG